MDIMTANKMIFEGKMDAGRWSFMFDEYVGAIAMSLDDSWSEAFSLRVDAFLAQDENFCFGKRYRGHNAAHRSALAAARMVEHFQSLHYVENKRSWEDGPASESVLVLQGVLHRKCKPRV